MTLYCVRIKVDKVMQIKDIYKAQGKRQGIRNKQNSQSITHYQETGTKMQRESPTRRLLPPKDIPGRGCRLEAGTV